MLNRYKLLIQKKCHQIIIIKSENITFIIKLKGKCMHELIETSQNKTIDYCVEMPAGGLFVKEIPLSAIWVEGDEDEMLDAIVMRDSLVAKKFVDMAIVAKFITREQVLNGQVLVTVDRTDDKNTRGDVNVETRTDIYTFTPLPRSSAHGPSYMPVNTMDYLEDEVPAWKTQIKELKKLMSI
jgi:hypothetical protein